MGQLVRGDIIQCYASEEYLTRRKAYQARGSIDCSAAPTDRVSGDSTQ